jgi:hypothetical protein
MADKEKIYKIYNNLPLKLNLCCNTSINQIEDKNDPTIKLLSNYDEINKILRINEPNILRFIYINRDNNHQILYDSEKNISLGDDFKSNIYLYFYLSLSIKAYPDFVDYKYSLNFIKNLNEEQIREKHKIKKKIIIAKIINDIIENYNQSKDNDEEDEEDEEKEDNKNNKDLKLIEETNLKIITNNIKAFEEFNLKKQDILSNNIDDIYISIIKYLITKQKLEESDSNTNLLEEIGLESIYLTKKMIDEISPLLDKDKSYLTDYIISKYEDIFDEKKITFYYYLFTYILKNNYYIYQIPFLLDTRNNIKKFIREKFEEFCLSIKANKSKNYINRIEYVLKAFIPYDWYLKQSLMKKKEKDKINFNSNISSNQSKSNQIEYSQPQNTNSISNNNNFSISSSGPGYFSGKSYLDEKSGSMRGFENDDPLKPNYAGVKERCSNDICFKILQNSIFTFNVSKIEDKTIIKPEKIQVIEKNRTEEIYIDEVMEKTSEDKILNDNYQKLLSIIRQINNTIEKEFINNFSFKYSLTFKLKAIKDVIFNITCSYHLEIPDKEPNEYKDEDILKEKTLGNFLFFLNEINSIDE